MVKHLPTVQETRVQSLGQEDLLEKEIATHSSTLAQKIPWTEEPGRLQSMGSQRTGHYTEQISMAQYRVTGHLLPSLSHLLLPSANKVRAVQICSGSERCLKKHHPFLPDFWYYSSAMRRADHK